MLVSERNIVANDNRILEELSEQHLLVIDGDEESLQKDIAALRIENAEINKRAEENAENAVDAKSLASGALDQLGVYLGTFGGPLGGFVGTALDGIQGNLNSHDSRILVVKETSDGAVRAASRNTERVNDVQLELDALLGKFEQLSPDLRDALNQIGNVDEELAALTQNAMSEEDLHNGVQSLLASKGISKEQIEELTSQLSTSEIVALLGVLGAATGGGAYASKFGKSRSAEDIKELKRQRSPECAVLERRILDLEFRVTKLDQ